MCIRDRYGLRIYKNMPLIEPVETKENLRIEELVIVDVYKRQWLYTVE